MKMNWFKGHVRLGIDELCLERFFNICGSRGIILYDIKPWKNGYSFVVTLEDYYSLRPIVRKAKPCLKLLDKYGLPFMIKSMLKHSSFFIGGLIFLGILLVLKQFIWNISISGNMMYSDEQMYNYLSEYEITYGTLKSAVDCEALEAQIRKDFNGIIWVSVALEGTRLNINVRENTDNIIELSQGSPSDILAHTDGIVDSIVVRSGTPIVKEGDIVKKGDILVSGTVVTYDEGGNPIKEDYVYADGDVYLYIQLPYSQVLQRNYIYKAYSGNYYKSVSFNFGEKLIDVKPYSENYEYVDKVSENWSLCLYQDFYLPVNVITTYYYEYTPTKAKYTDEQLNFLLERDFNDYLEKLEEKGIQIVENNVKITVNENEAQMYGFIYAIEKTELREAITHEYN